MGKKSDWERYRRQGVAPRRQKTGKVNEDIPAHKGALLRRAHAEALEKERELVNSIAAPSIGERWYPKSIILPTKEESEE